MIRKTFANPSQAALVCLMLIPAAAAAQTSGIAGSQGQVAVAIRVAHGSIVHEPHAVAEVRVLIDDHAIEDLQ